MKKLTIVKYFVLSLALVALLPIQASAVPQSFNYQGYITDAQGEPVNGPVNIVLGLYKDLAGGEPIDTHDAGSVSVVDGVFSTFYDMSGVVLPENDDSIYLEVSVEGAPMSPRKPLRSVLYALHAEKAKISLPNPQLAGKILYGKIVPESSDSMTLVNHSGGLTFEHSGTGLYDIQIDQGIFGGNTPVIVASGESDAHRVSASCAGSSCTITVIRPDIPGLSNGRVNFIIIGSE